MDLKRKRRLKTLLDNAELCNKEQDESTNTDIRQQSTSFLEDASEDTFESPHYHESETSAFSGVRQELTSLSDIDIDNGLSYTTLQPVQIYQTLCQETISPLQEMSPPVIQVQTSECPYRYKTNEPSTSGQTRQRSTSTEDEITDSSSSYVYSGQSEESEDLADSVSQLYRPSKKKRLSHVSSQARKKVVMAVRDSSHPNDALVPPDELSHLSVQSPVLQELTTLNNDSSRPDEACAPPDEPSHPSEESPVLQELTTLNNDSSHSDDARVLPDEPSHSPEESPALEEVTNLNNQNVECNSEHSRSRSRKADPLKWKANMRKRCRQKGENYISQRGKNVPAKVLLPSDCTKCWRQCPSIDDDTRHNIHQHFWNLGDSEKQRQYISSLVEEVPKTNTKTANTNSRRLNTKKYFFYKDCTKIQVCQRFFLRTLNVSETFVRNIIKKRDGFCIVPPSKRGRHAPGRKRPDAQRNLIKEHIQSFPTVPSHYCRKKTNFQYLPEDLNLNTMLYTMYVDFCKEKNFLPEKKWLYREVFHTCNMKFHTPRKDMCDDCLKYKQSKPEEKENLFASHMEHVKRKIEARRFKDESKNQALQVESEIEFLQFDLEAVRYCPKVNSKAIFYKRRLAVYNLTLYNVRSKHATNYVWHEGQAGRGSNEIASCIFKYFKECSNGKKFVLMSDTCGGQNRNVNVAAMLLYSVRTFDIPSIDHAFFEPGHSMMECDSVHAHIETTSKNINIFHPSGWYSVIQLASKDRKYEVCEMGQEDFLDFVKLRKEIIKNRKIDSDGNEVNWLKISLMQYRKEDPDHIYIKYRKSELEFRKIKVIRRAKTRRDIENRLQRAYTSPLKLAEEKMNDLVELCEKGIIPTQYHDFYYSLRTGQTVTEFESEED